MGKKPSPNVFLLSVFFLILIVSFQNCGRMNGGFTTMDFDNHQFSLSSTDSSNDSLSTPLPQQTPSPQQTPPVQNFPTTSVLEPAGSQKAVNCDMKTSDCAGQVYAGSFHDWGKEVYNSPTRIINDNSDPLSGPYVADAFLPLGSTSGGSALGWYNSAGTREIYVRALFKVNSDYSCSIVGKSKIFFGRSFENPAGGTLTNGVFLFGGCGKTKTFEFSHNTGSLNNGHTCGADDIGNLCFNNRGPGTFQAGEWVNFEFCISASTSTTARNGVVWWAVNGVMAGAYGDMNYGTNVANEFVWNQTWDGYGNGKGFTTDTHQYLGHLYISTPPIGGCRSMMK